MLRDTHKGKVWFECGRAGRDGLMCEEGQREGKDKRLFLFALLLHIEISVCLSHCQSVCLGCTGRGDGRYRGKICNTVCLCVKSLFIPLTAILIY